MPVEIFSTAAQLHKKHILKGLHNL